MVIDDHHVVFFPSCKLSHFLHGHFRILRKGWIVSAAIRQSLMQEKMLIDLSLANRNGDQRTLPQTG